MYLAYSRDVANNVHGNVQAIQYLTRFKAPLYKSTNYITTGVVKLSMQDWTQVVFSGCSNVNINN